MRVKPPHYPISVNRPAGHSDKWDIDVTLHTNIGSGLIRILYYFVTRYRYGRTDETYRHSFLCGIPDDATVSISIGSPGVRWSSEFYAVTAKDNYDRHLGSITMQNDTVIFKVKKWNGSQIRHFLNLNVEFLQGYNSAGVGVWIKKTIDPDVINPRPAAPIYGDEEYLYDIDGKQTDISFSVPPDDMIPYLDI